jgi:hypothetical protein
MVCILTPEIKSVLFPVDQHYLSVATTATTHSKKSINSDHERCQKRIGDCSVG